jgi:hypothetical protein
VSRTYDGPLAIWTHSRRERKYIAGCEISVSLHKIQHTGYSLLIIDFSFRVTVCFIRQPGLATSPWIRLVFVLLVFLGVQPLFYFGISIHSSHFIPF